MDWWCTVNEPEVYAFRAYSEGAWPPGRRDDGRALAVMGNLLEAHGRAYCILHDEDRTDADGDGRAAVVGFAKHLPQFVPDRPWFVPDLVRAGIEDRVFNGAVLRAAVTGWIALSIPGAAAVKRHVPELEQSLDYIGLNYYTRWRVRALSHTPHVVRRGAPVNDLGWEVWPDGLGRAARRAATAGAPSLFPGSSLSAACPRRPWARSRSPAPPSTASRTAPTPSGRGRWWSRSSGSTGPSRTAHPSSGTSTGR